MQLTTACFNQRILSVSDTSVSFRMKDYGDEGKTKSMTLDGGEFLRRFCLHILPKRICKNPSLRYLFTSKQGGDHGEKNKMVIPITETLAESIKRLTGNDPCLCPVCKKGRMVMAGKRPCIRSLVTQ